MNDPNKTSSYERNRTLGEIAESYADGLRARARDGKRVTHYGRTERIVLTYELAGGGPGADVTIYGEGTLDRDGIAELTDVTGGTVTYYEATGRAEFELGYADASDIYEALERSSDEDDERLEVP